MGSIKILGIGTLVAWGALGFIIFRFDPFVGGAVASLLFYFAFSLAALGTTMVVGLSLKRLHSPLRLGRHQIGLILRQAILFVAFLVLVLFLASRDLLLWWNIIPLALLTLMVEFFISSLNHKNRIYRNSEIMSKNGITK